MLQPSDICIRTYTYMLTARAVHVVRYPTLSREIRVCRTKGGERGVGLRD